MEAGLLPGVTVMLVRNNRRIGLGELTSAIHALRRCPIGTVAVRVRDGAVLARRLGALSRATEEL